jgi:hypothetical protein
MNLLFFLRPPFDISAFGTMTVAHSDGTMSGSCLPNFPSALKFWKRRPHSTPSPRRLVLYKKYVWLDVKGDINYRKALKAAKAKKQSL